MQRPRLYLHIGMAKTATTTIQGFLHANREILKRQGYLYPDTGLQGTAHHLLGNLFRARALDWIGQTDPAALASDLRRELNRSGCRVVVMSSESLSGRGLDADKLAAFFSDFDVTVLMWLRRQDEWVESAMRDNIKTGHLRPDTPPADYIQVQGENLDFRAKLAKWRSVFGDGNLSVRVFPPPASVGVEAAFLDQIGLRLGPEYRLPGRNNDRMSRESLAFLSGARVIPHLGPAFWAIARILAEFSRQNPDPPQYRYIIPPDMRRAVMDRYAEGNAAVARDYLGRADGVLFAPASEDEVPWEPYPGLSATRAIEIGQYLSVRLFGALQECRSLPKR